jgi:hypothetical protein
MSRGRRGATPIVSRAYRETPDACVRALTLLLKSRDSKKAVESAPGPDSADHVRSDPDAHTATRASIPQ